LEIINDFFPNGWLFIFAQRQQLKADELIAQSLAEYARHLAQELNRDDLVLEVSFIVSQRKNFCLIILLLVRMYSSLSFSFSCTAITFILLDASYFMLKLSCCIRFRIIGNIWFRIIKFESDYFCEINIRLSNYSSNFIFISNCSFSN